MADKNGNLSILKHSLAGLNKNPPKVSEILTQSEGPQSASAPKPDSDKGGDKD